MTKVHSTTAAHNRKKPHRDFPLTRHPSGQRCKKILGKLHYFGKDPGEALARWLEVKDDLLRWPAARPRSGPDALLMRDSRQQVHGRKGREAPER